VFFIELLAGLMLCLGSFLVIQLLRAADADGPLSVEPRPRQDERLKRRQARSDYRRAA
jgi:hypothetical protein